MARQANWYPLRMSEELHAQVKDEAKREHRSMNAVLLIHLQHSYATSAICAAYSRICAVAQSGASDEVVGAEFRKISESLNAAEVGK